MTKNQAIAEWIENVYKNITGTIIVLDENNEYFVTGHRLKNDTVVYTYGMFVNSSANLEVDDIAQRF